ncbi:MAG: UDP-N-acetylmuramate/alanine ligase [uncultured bacterium]|nr:MAG: UDP-N-acetylmuramate/alanine ligase [uncultured bacterium]
MEIKYKRNASLKEFTTVRIGGTSDYLFEPDSLESLNEGIKIFKEKNIPFFIIGGGSNVLISDNGYKGAVIKLSGDYFNKLVVKDGYLTCGAAVKLSRVVDFALENSIGGFEFLYGIPGTLGGAVAGNAGTAENGICEIVHSVNCVDFYGNTEKIIEKDIKYQYRECASFFNRIILDVNFSIINADKERNIKNIEAIRQKRESNPKGFSLGSIFKNPPGLKVWEIIDKMGLRGLRIGDCEVSNIHPNWIINKGNATGNDFFQCISLIREKAKKEFGVNLELEIKILGNFKGK